MATDEPSPPGASEPEPEIAPRPQPDSEPQADTNPTASSPAAPALEPWGDPPYPGGELVRATWIGTAVLSVTSVLAVVFLGPIRYVHVAVVLGMFAVGCLFFLRAYWTAVQRSREFEIGIGGLFFLAGPTAPNAVKRTMNWSFGLQGIVAIAAASARPFTSLAFGVLAPMWGLGLNGIWGATFGRYGPRIVDGPRRPAAPSSRPPGPMGKNASHG